MKIDRKLFEAALQIAKKGISKKADITSNSGRNQKFRNFSCWYE